MTRALHRIALGLGLAALIAGSVAAQSSVRPPERAEPVAETTTPTAEEAASGSSAQNPPRIEGMAPREATGGAQTLEDILARQRGEAVDDQFRRDAVGGEAPTPGSLGTLGGASDAELFRQMRFNTADITVSSGGPVAGVLMQEGGMEWLQFREGPLVTWGLRAMGGMLVLLLLFYLVTGTMRIQGGRTGIKVPRFTVIERLTHWVMAISFVLLGITGILNLVGRNWVIPLVGHEAYAPIAQGGIFVHNTVCWAFMLALTLAFLMWVLKNIPNRHDAVWLVKAGGVFSKHSHPPARKFNAGQKIIFWMTMILGASVSASGLSLLFPFEFDMFRLTFEKLNAIGAPGWVGMAPLDTTFPPHVEMQYAQMWHAIVAFAFMALILAHIYLGTVGMEGAFEAMTEGSVDRQWAAEHHNLWLEELEAAGKAPPAGARQPAE